MYVIKDNVIKLSVRGLVEFICRSGDIDNRTGGFSDVRLMQEGLNIIGLPKTIDNDIYGTDVTFGFHTAVDIATDVIDKIRNEHKQSYCKYNR